MGDSGREEEEEPVRGGDEDKRMILDQDRFLPIANVARIMKREIQPGGKIAKDAKECVQECVSEFIAFVASEASERCANEKRKTINGEDVLASLKTLGFDNYLPPLTAYLSKYREAQKGDKSEAATGRTPEDISQESGGASGGSGPVLYLDPASFPPTSTSQSLIINPNGTLQFVQLIPQPTTTASTSEP